ncbi:hypothetical protein QBC37DRAFT_420170 [Rhypophila decipiens]|uniref:Nephrocystin 3-like N-terminal domain-containing protein n=1 Tax=Rhypophila decipiens TaxID=261697 RepID=A0AAN6YA02_9PEZI|nr:hypothetical protein QBC37DRAFT_420170 [Rhypophila decipiens]
MAEVAASIIAFIQLTDTVIRVCSHFIGNAKDAPRDMVIIASEVTSLRAILSCFHQDELHPRTAEALPTLFAPSGPIQACYKAISALERLLPKVPDDATRKTSFNLSDLSWALKDSQVRKLLAEITLHKSTLLLALTGDLMHEIKQVKAAVGRVEHALTRAERTEVLEWLQSKCHNPSVIHNRMLEQHEEHTGEWLPRWKKWNLWLQSEETPEDRFLWIHGIPGAGKSVIASVAIESIKARCEDATGRQLGYAYYYCHYSHNEDSGSPFLRWIISRLSHQSDWVPPQLKRFRDSGYEPTIAELLSVLQSIMPRFSAVYVALDGVDESQPRKHLLSVLTTLATDKHFQTLRLVATSRLHQDIEQSFSGITTSISMSNAFVSQDIQTVVRNWITSSPRMRCWSHLSEWIEERLCSGAHGMFRWVACQMNILERIREESQLVHALNCLPHDLDEVYIRLLDGIPEIDRPFVRRVLLWIAGHSSCNRLRDQGIHIDALVGAVCDDLQHLTGRTYRYTADDLRELCGCLITVQEHKLPFTDFLTEVCMARVAEGDCIVHKKGKHLEEPPKGYFVSMAHYTVVEFLASDRILASPVRWCFMRPVDIADEFSRSVIRQSLTADPAGTSADWVRDREPYCLTLVPLVLQNINIDNPEMLDLCVRYFLPTSPHYSRLGQIQAHLVTGCEDAQSFLMARLPVYDPRLLPSEYQHNDPDAWAILGMIVSYNRTLAERYTRSFTGLKYNDMVGKGLLVTLLKSRGDGMARYKTYRTTLGEELNRVYMNSD